MSFEFKVLYEDNHLIAVHKPAGILVQANEKGVENLLDVVKEFVKKRDNKPGNVFLGLVHRLDRPVSGVVVFAKTSKGASRLSEQFRNREVRKIYTALVEGKINKEGELVHFLKKDPDKLTAKISENEKEDYQKSELSYKTISSNAKYSLLSINLGTGRFNQIRAQFSHIGHPIVGDSKYGFKIQNSKFKIPSNEIALCATEISFKKTTSDEAVRLKIDYPNEWDKFFDAKEF